MTATNHAATGALIAITVNNPIALPLAFASHFILDTIPHFGMPVRNKKFIFTLVADGLIVLLLTIFLITTTDIPKLLMLSSIILAILPDVAWAFRWYKEAKYGSDPKQFHDPLTKMHSKIQWFEKPIGIIAEVGWFLLMLVLLYGLI